jgi:glycosyltransferase involved in cell wall biosynthesis
VLFVSYAFPPVGGAGVQRTTKFVKYLPSHGWQCSVLTAKNPSVPVLDERLLDEIPPETRVVRTRTFEPSYAAKQAVAGAQGEASTTAARARALLKLGASALLQPDAQMLWNVTAVRAGLSLLREQRHDAIVASGPPFSSFLLGALLARLSGVPLVLDYRDEWDISNAYWENKKLDQVSLRVQRAMQRAAVREAAALVATSRPSMQALERVRDEARSRAQVVCLYNGFDSADFEAYPAGSRVHGGRYRLSYLGTLWNLTDVTPVVEAVELLADTRPELLARLELFFAGRRTEPQEAILARLRRVPIALQRLPYVEHGEVIGLLKSSDGLLVLLSDVPHAERVVPGKVFEYMASGRTVLCVAPPGEAWHLLEGYPRAHRVHPRDTLALAEVLASELERRARDEPGPSVDPSTVARFDRKSQAGELAQLLESIAPSRAR